MQVVGVNGARGGWLAISYDTARRELKPQVHATFPDVLGSYPDATCIAIDIPIGLAEGSPRRCDIEARKVLGPRRSSVFPAPDRRLVDAINYAEANGLSRSLLGKGVSAQAFGIYPKVAEVNRMMTPQLQVRVVEVHPDVSFWALAGKQPTFYPKRTAEGFEERRALLATTFDGSDIPSREMAGRLVSGAGADDLLDATVAAWTARRFAEGRAGRLPIDPDVDERGLRMEMVY